MKQEINLTNVSFSYLKKVPVLKNISLLINRGDFIGITGVNGSGKSTLCYLFNGIIPHLIKGGLTGTIHLDGADTRNTEVSLLSLKAGFLFQNPDFSLFNLTVEEEIAFGLKNFGFKNVKERVQKILSTLGISTFRQRDPHELSWGEKQKVNLASLLALDTPYLILDEPTSMLDYKSSLELYNLLHKLNKEGKTVVVVEHDTDFIRHYCARCVILDQGKIVIDQNTDKAFTNRKYIELLGVKYPARKI
ncbi:hypothetical protein A2Y99_01900 [Candidatus Gottesmanbacteria bacterium RBG_13_37_7]|uniref:ABC transporter domain-containing protein n=1 Tax=Candidatus Gottesmanbacteria bacterium RBG_13_37_7 TaxID=1798369 RepID=A0A1F5YJH8_9BACT|nr:MAG: hypothetical protein A2Y99_01900 [Candidatus Gottesmanbacteria bacterium RBG_13_37_7]